MIMFAFEVADDHTGLEHGVPMVALEALLTYSVDKRFDMAVTPRRSRRDVGQANFAVAELMAALGK